MKRPISFVVGLVITGLLGLGDLVTLPFGDGKHPPFAVALAGAVLGLLTLIGVVLAWRGSRLGVVIAIVTRLLAALTAVPAFFADGVPAPAIGAAAFGIAVTLLCVALLARALRPSTTAVA